MPQLAEYAEGIDLPEELVALLTDAFDEDGCVCVDGRRLLVGVVGWGLSDMAGP